MTIEVCLPAIRFGFPGFQAAGLEAAGGRRMPGGGASQQKADMDRISKGFGGIKNSKYIADILGLYSRARACL